MGVALLDVLFPHMAGVHVDRAVAAGTSVRFDATTSTPTADCPACGQPSGRIHSRYVRWLGDHGVGGRQVRIRLQVRRLFCHNPDCPRRIFAEQIPGLTSRYQPRPPRLQATLAQVGLALGGRAGQRMSHPLGSETRTLCRDLVVLMNQAAEAVPPPNAGGDRDRARRSSGGDTAGRAKRKASVRSLVVVVAHVLVEHSLKVASAPDQHPVQTLLPDRADPALGGGVGPRRQLLVIRKVRKLGCG